ncbi:hypothetical protein ACS0TY_027570 [Phlomoides rotata]
MSLMDHLFSSLSLEDVVKEVSFVTTRQLTVVDREDNCGSTEMNKLCRAQIQIGFLFWNPRRALWADLNLIQHNPAPLCIIGDFNVVLGAHRDI